ncbi:MAG: hypothetical protein ACLQM8_04450 [Limisphaerales bacterium]
MQTLTQWIAGALGPRPAVPQDLKPAAWQPAAYDRSVVFGAIVAKSGGGELAIAGAGEIQTLKDLQTEWGKWAKATGLDGEAARQQLQATWEAQVEHDEKYDPYGFLSDYELSRRFVLRQAVCAQHHRRVAAEARPVAVAILGRLPDAAARLVPAAEREEEVDKLKVERRGMTWLPSLWLRLLWQTQNEVKAQIERVQQNRVAEDSLSPADMLCNCIRL